MGLTIAFSGRIAPSAIRRVLRAAAADARERLFGASSCPAAQLPPALARLADDPECALVIRPHFAADPLHLIPDPESGELLDAIATKSRGDAPLALARGVYCDTGLTDGELHAEIIAWLRTVSEQPGVTLQVDDESERWRRAGPEAERDALDRSWGRVAEQVTEALSEAQAHGSPPIVRLGDFLLRSPVHPERPQALEDDHVRLLAQLADGFSRRWSAGLLPFEAENAQTLDNLDLVASEIDDAGGFDSLDQEDAELFVHGAGAIYGAALAKRLGGAFHLGEEGSLVVGGLAGIGLEVDPFAFALQRLQSGSWSDFSAHAGVCTDLARRLGPALRAQRGAHR